MSLTRAWYNRWAVLQKKKGPGRGWWAPPKGTHGGSLPRDSGLQAALPKGTKIRWHAGLVPEARVEPDNSILLGPRFWGPHMDDEVRASVLAHEFGHTLEQVSGAFTGEGFDNALVALKIPMPKWAKRAGKLWWGYGGETQITEALAWAYRDYVAGKLTRGAAFDFVDSLVVKHPEYGRVDFSAIVAKLEPGPKGGIMTIFDKTQS